uniref:Uncharacterized protein n=1 Tax=Arundo donax TaxID=35708 RepID=A0A0A9AG35_ARUDO
MHELHVPATRVLRATCYSLPFCSMCRPA